MKLTKLITPLFTLALCCSLTQNLDASPLTQRQGITVQILGLPQPTGTMHCSLFAQRKGFPDQAQYALQTVKVKLKHKRATCHFSVSTTGSYAVAVWHDVNDNHQIDKTWFGAPKEPVGASNNAAATFGPPSFTDARFLHERPATEIYINLG